jgi:RimJ/RimL family protein N-acetyltransferase
MSGLFSLQLLGVDDLEWLRELRNANRSNFFSMQEVTPEQQRDWFRTMPWGDQRWVIWDRQTRCGYFSIERPKPDLPIFPSDKPVWYLNSLLVDEVHRGRGVIQAAGDALDGALTYVGYVREGNAASLRACAKLGLVDRGLYTHPEYGKIHLVWKP